MELVYAVSAAKDLQDLPPAVARRIVRKIAWSAAQRNPLSFAKRLADPRLGDYRFRIGDYRVLVDVRDGEIRVLLVLAVRHRKDAYGL